jgi:predicted GIY-YIG superfamily endonuclease
VPFVYILRCGDGSLYTGIAKDLARRLEQHQLGTASKYTRSHLPVTLVWQRRVMTWSRALQEELRIKALTRAEKEELVLKKSVSRRRPRT